MYIRRYISEISLPRTYLGMLWLSACLLVVAAGCAQISEPAATPASTPYPVAQTDLVASSSRITAPSSVDELIFLSDIIVRARLLSAETGVIPRYGKHMGVFEFRFQAIEYLKGSGADELIVKVPISNYEVYDDRESAKALADASFTYRLWLDGPPLRDDRWDDRDAIVFLEHPISEASGATSQSYYEFTGPDEISVNINEYSVSSPDNKAWLPAAASSGAVGGTAGVSADPQYLTDATRLPAQGAAGTASSSAPSISLSEIKERIDQTNDLVAEGSDIPGYHDCLRQSFRFDAYARAGRFPPSKGAIEAPSGQVEGYRLNPDLRYDTGNVYEKWWTAGPDSHLFIIRITEDPDNDPSTGYAWEQVATRPIPRGEYTVFYNSQPAEWIPCNYQPEWDLNTREITIAITAPDGVLHEAFFDPAPLGIGVGANSASGGVGALEPAEFTHNGASVAIEQIEWSTNTNKVDLKLSNQSAKLAGHHIDFIELDASVSLRLDIDDAETTSTGYGQTLSWEVCRQPWHPGDLLMLRIAKSAATDSATIKPVCVDDGKPAATATPPPKTTPTHTPTATSDTTATPTYTPTASPTPPQPTATVVPTATPTNTPATAPTTTPTPAPTLTPTPPAGGVSGAIDTPTPTPTSTPTATATHTPTIAPTATLESSSGGVTGQ